MQELSYEKHYIKGTNVSYGLVFNMLGTYREHFELFNKGTFDYKGYKCYVGDLKIPNIEKLDGLHNFEIIAIDIIKEEK